MLFTDPENPEALRTQEEVIEYLGSKGVTVIESGRDTAEIIFAVVIGGDGTILKAANLLAQKRLEVPILGINKGHRGFLAAVQNGNWQSYLDRAIAGHYIEKKRTRIEVVVIRDYNKIFQGDALNEIYFMRVMEHSINLDIVSPDGSLVDISGGCNYIFSTRTGSTALNAAANGTVITREDQFVITVVNPIRKRDGYSIEVDNSKGKFLFTGPERNRLMVEIDGKQPGITIEPGDRVLLSKSPMTSNFMEFAD